MATTKTKKPDPSEKRNLFGLGFSKDREYVLENLAMLLSAGMDVLSALDSLKHEIGSSKMKKILAELEFKISDGSALWRALEPSKLLPSYMLSLVRTGEESGRLTENLKVLVNQQVKDREFKSKLKSAMVYPGIVFGLTVVIGLGVAWFILPKLSVVFASLNQTMPWITKVFINFGSTLKTNGVFIVPAIIILLVFLVYILFINYKTKHLGQEVFFHFPGIRRLIQEVEISRFGFILGTLLDSGIPVIESINSLRQATTLVAYQKFYEHIKHNIEQGNSFKTSFETFKGSRRLLPSPYQQLIVSGEKSGRLSESLQYIGKIFDNKIENSSKNIAVILEPVLLVIVWLGVVAVAVAVILPIYNMLGNFNTT
ncbi:MAG: type II secretion system F family protein [Patescibacteria group bacterium]|jgi:type II secretory pathway component PulF